MEAELLNANFQEISFHIKKKKIKFQNAYLEENREEPSSYILVGHTAGAVRANLRSLMYQNEFHINKTGTSD